MTWNASSLHKKIGGWGRGGVNLSKYFFREFFRRGSGQGGLGS
jgi:hypothetical protein